MYDANAEYGVPGLSPDSFKDIIENTSLGICIADENGQFEYVNDAFVKIYGYTLEEIAGKPCIFQGGNSRESFVPDGGNESTDGILEKHDIRKIRNKNGSDVFVLVYENFVTDPTDKKKKFTYVIDITGPLQRNEEFSGTHSRLEGLLNDRNEELLQQKEVYNYATSGLHEVILLHEKNGDIVYVSPSIKVILGYEADTLIGQSIYSLIHPDDTGNVRYKYFDRIPEGGKDTKIRYRVLTKSGHLLWFESSSKLVRSERKNSVYYLTSLRNISDVVEKEEEIRMLERLPRENPNPVMRVKRNREVRYNNDAARELLDFWKSHFGDPFPSFWTSVIDRVIAYDVKEKLDIDVGGKDYYFSVSRGENEDEVYVYGLDVTEKRRTEQELHLTNRIFETTIEGILVTDNRGVILSVNPAFTNITGYRTDEVVGKKPSVLKSDRHDKEFYRNMWFHIISNGQWTGEIWNRRKNGEIYPEWLSITAVRDDIGQIQYYVAVFTDISEIKMKEAEVRHQALHDPLTDLPNRLLLNDRLHQAIEEADTKKLRLALLYMDMDRFKVVNDSLGHLLGDILLQHVARRLESILAVGQTVSRVGGDEFVFLLPSVQSVNPVIDFANRIREEVTRPYHIQGNEIYLSPSIGVSFYPDDASTVSDLFRHADLAMYEAKAEGGNRLRFFSASFREEVENKLKIENSLRKALDHDELELFYQPIVDIKTGRIHGAEALLRWLHPEKGYISPVEFIPPALESGLIIPITEEVLKMASSQFKKWLDIDPDLYVSVNLTSHSFRNNLILAMVEKTLARYEYPSDRLVLEITEDSLMDNMDETREVMKILRDRGVRFSIDDFGRGYSSLAYLKKLPIDNLKIDRSFVADIAIDEDSRSIVNTIIALANSLNLGLITEGVETEQQMSFFRDKSKMYIQGYYYSKPVTAPDFEVLIRSQPFLINL